MVSADIQREADGWHLSLVVECEPHRERTGDLVAGLDWGVSTLATLCHGPHLFAEMPNDRLLAQEQDVLASAQKALSRALRGKRTKAAARAKLLLAKRSRRLANRRKDRNHQTTARLAASHAVIVTEDLAIENMTASAKGTADKPGKNVAQKAGLNRAILDASPGGRSSMLRCKVKETGAWLVLVDPRLHKPSQTDPVSGERRKKSLAERTHTLPDGMGIPSGMPEVIGRDEAAAWVLWNIGQRILGEERAGVEAPETARQAA